MFKQTQLKYDYNALEPHIDELTMITHYSKHHLAYTNNFNAAVEKVPALAGKSAEEIFVALPTIGDLSVRSALQNNGGGFYNHNIYFEGLSPNGGGEPTGSLLAQIEKDFGSFAEFKEKISAAALSRFGSGWAWLSADSSGKLSISSTANQDNPIMESAGALSPVLAIDVWEHAYYLKYKNLRADYVKSFFEVVDWQEALKKYEAAKK